MTWVKLDDQFFTNSKAQAAGRDGRDLFIAGLCYCSANLTDGAIPKSALPIVAAMAGVRQTASKALVTTGLWTEDDSTFHVHDYLEHQSSKEKIEAERDRSRQRKERFRERQRNAKRNGGGNAVPNGGGTENATGPRRPLEAEAEADPLHRSTGATGPPDHLEEDLIAVCGLISERKLKARADQGGRPPDSPSAWLAKVIATDIARLRPAHRTLRDEHPDWTIEDLADELDPQTAPRIGNYMDAEQTAEWLAEQARARAEAVPMPEHMRP